jgi:hypothetical protein
MSALPPKADMAPTEGSRPPSAKADLLVRNRQAFAQLGLVNLFERRARHVVDNEHGPRHLKIGEFGLAFGWWPVFSILMSYLCSVRDELHVCVQRAANAQTRARTAHSLWARM